MSRNPITLWSIVLLTVLAMQGCKNKAIVSDFSSGELTDVNWCLTRVHEGEESRTNVFVLADDKEWEAVNGLIHKEYNVVTQCGDGTEQCKISTGDVFEIDVIDPVKDIYEYSRDPDISGSKFEKSQLSLSKSKKRYLKGVLNWAMGNDADIYVLFTGYQPCSDFGYQEPGACKTFKIEIYPDRVHGWDSYKPDAKAATWVKAPCVSPLELTQPGGGGGHEPPD